MKNKPTDTDEFSEPSFEETADTEAGQKAERMARSFMSETARVGPLTIRKPCMAGITILTKARNKFVIGFTAEELAAMFPHGTDEAQLKAAGKELEVAHDELYQHLDAVWEICLIGQATPEQKKAWYFNPAAFRSAAYDFVCTLPPVPPEQLGEMFSQCLTLATETAEAQVKAVPAKPGAGRKKKGPRHPRSSSPTRGRSPKS